jgi:hypothetical protein
VNHEENNTFFAFFVAFTCTFFLWFVKVNSANVRTASATTVMTSLAGGHSKGAITGHTVVTVKTVAEHTVGAKNVEFSRGKNVKFSFSSITYLHPKRFKVNK